MGIVFRLSLRQLASRRRMLLVTILALLPIGLATLVAFFAPRDGEFSSGFINTLLDGMIVGVILPIVTIAMATAAFGDEVDDRTLHFLVLKPISRLRIVLPKLAAVIVVAGPVVVLSGGIATYVGLDSLRPAFAAAVGLAVGVTAYAAVFTWAGLATTRALPLALIYVLVWEGIVSTFLGGVRYMSVRAYTLSIMHGLDEDGLSTLTSRVIEFPAAVMGGILVSIVFAWLTVRRLRRMDVP